MQAEHAPDAERMLADAHALAYPRFPGSEGDRRAIEWLIGRFEEIGLPVRREEFDYDMKPVWRALRGALAASGLALGAAGFVALRSPAASAALLALALLASGALLVWAPGIERLYRRSGPTATANVEARRPAAGEPRLRLVLLAHHDSKSQNLTFPARAGLTLLSLLGTLGLAAWLVAALVFGGSPVFGATLGPAWLPAACGGAAAAALFVLATLKSENRSPGGVDNAGSVAVVLELARLLPALAPPDVELVFLSPGAEEDHMVGAMRWLDAHREELDAAPVLAINFDGAGNRGRIALLERFGLGRRFSPTLSAAARRAAGRLGIRVRGVLMPPGMGIDAIPFAHRGIDCLTLASGGLNRATMAIHSARDRAENLDRDTLELSARLALELAREVMREGGPELLPYPGL